LAEEAIAQILSGMDAEIESLEQKRGKYKALVQLETLVRKIV
jgi:hypothetical protein